MSLDLYIKTSTPVIKRGTGVYVREDGKTKELKTMAEVKERFPDADLSQIKVFEYETDEVWHENITHNMNKMADQVPIGEHTLYDYLWRPDEIGITHISREYAIAVFDGLMYLKEHKKELLPFEPPIDPETGTRGDPMIYWWISVFHLSRPSCPSITQKKNTSFMQVDNNKQI